MNIYTHALRQWSSLGICRWDPESSYVCGRSSLVACMSEALLTSVKSRGPACAILRSAGLPIRLPPASTSWCRCSSRFRMAGCSGSSPPGARSSSCSVMRASWVPPWKAMVVVCQPSPLCITVRIPGGGRLSEAALLPELASVTLRAPPFCTQLLYLLHLQAHVIDIADDEEQAASFLLLCGSHHSCWTVPPSVQVICCPGAKSTCKVEHLETAVNLPGEAFSKVKDVSRRQKELTSSYDIAYCLQPCHYITTCRVPRVAS